MPPSNDVASFREILQQSKNIIAVAGAGLSAASGIPTFRDAGGLWRTHDFMNLATPTAFAANPSRVWQFYHERRESALKAKPNAAHFALATISKPENLKIIAPSAKFTLITQNVDGLSVKAFQKACPGLKPNIYEMHGRLLDTLCTNCGDREHNTESPICPALMESSSDDNAVREIPLEDLPRCKTCGGLLRPGVVWFHEFPHHLDEIGKIVDEADIALIVGTSSTVYPAAGYAYEVAERGGTVVVFNLQRTEGDEDYAQYLFLGPCEETLPQVLFGDSKVPAQSIG